MRRHPFETYLDKVFEFSAKVDALPEGRQSPRHHGKKIFDAVFLEAACQFPSLHRIETECQKGALCKRIGALSEDAIRYALGRQDPGAIFALGCNLAPSVEAQWHIARTGPEVSWLPPLTASKYAAPSRVPVTTVWSAR